MKTVQELYNEIIADDELKKAYFKATQDGKLWEFIAEHDCDATVEELDEFMMARPAGELSDDELDNVAGGCGGTVKCQFCGGEVDAYEASCNSGMHEACHKKYMKILDEKKYVVVKP